jgi:hypothetical protein
MSPAIRILDSSRLERRREERPLVDAVGAGDL